MESVKSYKKPHSFFCMEHTVYHFFRTWRIIADVVCRAYRAMKELFCSDLDFSGHHLVPVSLL